MKRTFYLIFALLLLFNVRAWSANYYVSGNGNNANNGLSATSPFRDIQKAADLTKPGDIVYVMNGTYNNSCSVCDGVNISKSGTATSYIIYQAYPGHTPKIKFNGWQGIRVWGASYIEINGFEIEGNNSSITLSEAQAQAGNVNNPATSGNGIYMDPNGSAFPHHIRIRNNSIYNCGGHGIGSHFADYITIENNRIYNNAWYSPLGCSGISLYQNKNFDSFSGYRIFIRNNRINNNIMYIPFFYNGKIEDGNGIIIDDAKNTQNSSPHGVYAGSVKIENNVVFDNGGRGIHAFLSNNVHVVNNTTYMNCKSPEVKDGELSGYGGDNLRFYNNVTYSRSDARANHNGDGASTNIIFDYNIYYNFSTSKTITKGPNDIVADPKFVNPNVNPSLANFKVQATSPAVNSGTTTLAPATDFENVARPQGTAIDRGAYEYVGTSTPNAAPSVSITSPLNNSSYVAGTVIAINANAADSGGTISKVEFYQGTTKLGEDLASPYSYNWSATTAGTYTFTARATDNAGAVTASAPVSITITGTTPNAAPSVSITSPLNNSSYVAGTVIAINANATDSDGTISKVEFYQGTTKLGEDLASPYSYNWSATTAGTYTFTARATDNAGAVTASSPVSVTITGTTPNSAPSVSITSPLNNSSYVAGTVIAINANATDSDGTISKVEFYQGTTKLGEDLASPYSYNWSATTAGTYTFTARATDNAGAVTASSPVTITITSSSGGNCVSKPIPDASKWVVRNSWNDQSNGSKVSNTIDAMQITHRQWGSSYLWVVETGVPYTVTSGKTYNISFDFKDDANTRVTSVQAAFATSAVSADPVLLQPAVTAPSGYSATAYTSKSVSIQATASGTAYLSFRLNWASQPSTQVNDFIKNISICEVSAARFGVDEKTDDSGLYPNPTNDEVNVKLDFAADEAVQIEVMNHAGTVLRTYYNFGAESTVKIAGDLPSGLYIVRARSTQSEKVYRFVKN